MSGPNRSEPSSVIIIKQSVYDQLLTWGLSRNEFYAVCGGDTNGVIVVAIRIPNKSRNPRTSAEWNWHQQRAALKELRLMGCTWAADSHSHPGGSKAEPSFTDFKYARLGQIELLVKPEMMEISAWRYGKTYRQTLRSRLNLKII